jgi:phosphoribosyl 1,2-cyclic phosphodiesterase
MITFTPLASSSVGNAYLVQCDGVGPLLIEAGIPVKKLRERLWARGVSLSDLAGCVVSHEHGDHAKAVKNLLKAGVEIYASVGTAKALGIEGHHRYAGLRQYRTSWSPSGCESFDKPGWKIVPVPLEHDATEPLGFFIDAPNREGALLFIPDTSYIRNRFEGVTICAIECNHVADILSENIQEGHVPVPVGRRVRRNHMSLDTVVSMLKANDLSRCREIWLLHLSDSNSDEARMIKAVQEATGIPCRVAAA